MHYWVSAVGNAKQHNILFPVLVFGDSGETKITFEGDPLDKLDINDNAKKIQ